MLCSQQRQRACVRNSGQCRAVRVNATGIRSGPAKVNRSPDPLKKGVETDCMCKPRRGRPTSFTYCAGKNHEPQLRPATDIQRHRFRGSPSAPEGYAAAGKLLGPSSRVAVGCSRQYHRSCEDVTEPAAWWLADPLHSRGQPAYSHWWPLGKIQSYDLR